MSETLTKTKLHSEQETILPEISPATNEDILAYLRRSYKLAEIVALAERDAIILEVCDRLNLAISDEELQSAGDTFRLEHKLLGASETLAWLQQQRITVEDWTQGIRVELLTKKLQEHLFGDAVDAHYLSNRDDYRRVALSQILVRDLPEALKVVHALKEENASFCSLALEYSKGKQSKKNGGFVGICFVAKLLPEIARAISKAKEGEAIGPIQTQLGYHIVRVEQMFATELNESVREEILDSLFQSWLQAQRSSNRLNDNSNR
jgi:parvulin-like peptidyl-prolyl isomerase